MYRKKSDSCLNLLLPSFTVFLGSDEMISLKILQVHQSDEMFSGSSDFSWALYVCDAWKTVCLQTFLSTLPFCLAAELTPSVTQPVDQHKLRRSMSEWDFDCLDSYNYYFFFFFLNKRAQLLGLDRV